MGITVLYPYPFALNIPLRGFSFTAFFCSLGLPHSGVAKGGPSKGGRQSRRNSVIIMMIVSIIVLFLKKNLQHYQRNYNVFVVIGDPL